MAPKRGRPPKKVSNNEAANGAPKRRGRPPKQPKWVGCPPKNTQPITPVMQKRKAPSRPANTMQRNKRDRGFLDDGDRVLHRLIKIVKKRFSKSFRSYYYIENVFINVHILSETRQNIQALAFELRQKSIKSYVSFLFYIFYDLNQIAYKCTDFVLQKIKANYMVFQLVGCQ
ncbi:hypothetical protein PHYBLDRAFT_174696 [Phycomyces blakesleeanus NRRL 1555(-)]|uniref:Uncharacterized protein n=1 Tax=Phycomyces blakesleeanus (strain ATCC 8743b / DSM 1359 / FGSC 10004 / NBRC 33097 / NRRL 1555) TaxID=763407 RepID=A0A167JZR2_PHYB8|nr:hypothetical protein PHYBLDRAFT_174696 [Phycomyces blakesleeanus NRRL 1555(-)]OAD66989.1 hypothetical protein PHYBLDRAFT_174696 [Phycomyces blakesleeanus NRRL 1555(-)]|eukprot:XP_018285029.1 hypothetical protein PHYBLDRAFT_174696 [Phycomyces blakesleeanus NRRL 1555(-)]